MTKRLHIFYSGSVQGVGFRFAAERLAVSVELTGWIKNLSDGRVEVVCEGEMEVLMSFLENLKDSFGPRIWQADVRYEEATGEFKDFDIRL